MRDTVTIAYRGAGYELGKGRGFYGIWRAGSAAGSDPAGAPVPPLEWWPETPAGWSAAWARFSTVETPGSIAATGPDAAWAAGAGLRATIAVGLLSVGVVCGIVGLFPGYLGGASLASESEELLPHLIYIAAWAAAGGLVLLGGGRRRAGALLGAGVSAITFGLLFGDAATAISSSRPLAGAGLLLSLAGWLACTAGAALACTALPAPAADPATAAPAAPEASGPGTPGPAGPFGGYGTPATAPWTSRPANGKAILAAVLAPLAALGAAITFAPSWDSYTLRVATGASQTLTEGNAFSNPGAVIAGNVMVMIAIVAVAIAAVARRPIRRGSALLAGAIVPLVAQVISGMMQAGQTPTPAQFNFSPAQATQLGLTISSGLTAAFWAYCAFVLAMIVVCAWMALPPRAATVAVPPGVPAGPMPGSAAGPCLAPSPRPPSRSPA